VDGQRRRVGVGGAERGWVDVDVDEAVGRDEAGGPAARKLAEAGADHQHPAAAQAGEGRLDVVVAAAAGDADEPGVGLGEDALGARGADDGGAGVVDERAHGGGGVAGAPADPHCVTAVGERGGGGVEGGGVGRGPVEGGPGGGQRREGGALDGDRQGEVGDEAGRAGEAFGELGEGVGEVGGVVEQAGLVEQVRRLVQDRGGERGGAGLLHGPAAPLGGRGGAGDHDHLGALPAGGHRAGEGVEQAGAGGDEGEDGAAGGEAGLDRREQRAALVADLEAAQARAAEGVAQRGDGAADEAERVADAEVVEGVEQGLGDGGAGRGVHDAHRQAPSSAERRAACWSGRPTVTRAASG
jgi:hypothetical protein